MHLTGRSIRSFSARRRAPGALRFRRPHYKDTLVKPNVRRAPLKRSILYTILTPAGWGFTSLSIAVLGLLLWFFVFSTIFLVNNVTVTNSTTLSREDLNRVFYDIQDKNLLFFIPSNHIAFLSNDRLLKNIRDKFPFVSGITDFDRTWPNKITFAVVEENPSFLLVSSSGRRLVLNRSGEVLGEAVGQLPSNIVVVTAEISAPVVYGNPILTLPILNFARELQDGWLSNFKFRPARYQVVTDQAGLSAQAGGEFAVFMNEGWYIKVDSDDNPAHTLQNLNLIIDNEIKSEELRQQLAYIDLRLSTRAFYCLKSQPCASK